MKESVGQALTASARRIQSAWLAETTETGHGQDVLLVIMAVTDQGTTFCDTTTGKESWRAMTPQQLADRIFTPAAAQLKLHAPAANASSES